MTVFPERAERLSKNSSIFDLWFDLLGDLQAAYRQVAPDTESIDRTWAFAAWCFDAHRHHSVRGAVAAAFYEHLPHFGPARRELPQRLTRAQFDELIPYFKTALTEAELGEFVTEFLIAQGVRRPDIRKFLAAAT